MDHFPRDRGENKKYLEPPTSLPMKNLLKTELLQSLSKKVTPSLPARRWSISSLSPWDPRLSLSSPKGPGMSYPKNPWDVILGVKTIQNHLFWGRFGMSLGRGPRVFQ